MSKQYKRRVDDLGRVVIPKEFRKNMGIKKGDMLDVYIFNDEIVITKTKKEGAL